MSNLQEHDNLYHHGIKGQKWGVRQGPPYPLNRLYSLLDKGDSVQNLDSWGKDKQHNTLYITGFSGSGKTTTAKKFQDSKSEIIHLDVFFENPIESFSDEKKNSGFFNYALKNIPGYSEIVSDFKKFETKRFDYDSQEAKQYWSTMDELLRQTKMYGESLYPRKKLIVEGIQVYEGFGSPKEMGMFLKDVPVVIKGTGMFQSYFRRQKRDGADVLQLIRSGKDYVDWYKGANTQLKDLTKELDLKTMDEVKKFIWNKDLNK